MTNSIEFTLLKFLLITSSIAAIIYFGVALCADNNSVSPLQLDGEHNANEASQVSPIQLAKDSNSIASAQHQLDDSQVDASLNPEEQVVSSYGHDWAFIERDHRKNPLFPDSGSGNGSSRSLPDGGRIEIMSSREFEKRVRKSLDATRTD